MHLVIACCSCALSAIKAGSFVVLLYFHFLSIVLSSSVISFVPLLSYVTCFCSDNNCGTQLFSVVVSHCMETLANFVTHLHVVSRSVATILVSFAIGSASNSCTFKATAEAIRLLQENDDRRGTTMTWWDKNFVLQPQSLDFIMYTTLSTSYLRTTLCHFTYM